MSLASCVRLALPYTPTHTEFRSVLPAPLRDVQPAPEESPEAAAEAARLAASKAAAIPPYGKRGPGSGFVPRRPEDFGDGGAFPEIHVCQYPLNMGRTRATATTTTTAASGTALISATDASGGVRYEAVLGHAAGAVVHSAPSAALPLVERTLGGAAGVEGLERPDADAVAATTERTRQALDVLVGVKVAAAQPSRGPAAAQRQAAADAAEPQYVRYTPSERAVDKDSGSAAGPASLTVQLFQRPSDPLEPPKFKSHRVPRGPPSPPAPVLHSPPAKLTQADMQAWRIPPCVSNWKNNRGYTIPLDKRLAADGRGLADVTISDGFARLSEALYIAERNAREEVARRAELAKRYALREKEQREEALLKLAESARRERAAAAAATAVAPDDVAAGTKTETELEREAAEREERDRLRDERRLEREREHKLEAYKGKRDKAARDAGQRDFAEAVALGTARTGGAELMYDQRLFNQSQGVASGFGDEEDYTVYSRPLFTDGRSASLYRPTRTSDEAAADQPVSSEAAQAAYDRITKTDRFRADKPFSGTAEARQSHPRTGPVEFERAPAAAPTQEADPFGVSEFLDSAKRAADRRHTALDHIGSGGTMFAASASFGTSETYDGGSGRTSVAFRSAGTTDSDASRSQNAGLSHKHRREEHADGESLGESERKRHHRH